MFSLFYQQFLIFTKTKNVIFVKSLKISNLFELVFSTKTSPSIKIDKRSEVRWVGEVKAL
jgi:hypothetical protein